MVEVITGYLSPDLGSISSQRIAVSKVNFLEQSTLWVCLAIRETIKEDYAIEYIDYPELN